MEILLSDLQLIWIKRSPFSQTGYHIDVTAPGGFNLFPDNDLHDIYSTWIGDSYRYAAGTSMAAPIVSGIASLLKGYRTDLTNDDLEWIIKLSAEDKGLPGFDYDYGYGRVNARYALDRLRPSYVLNHLTTTGNSTYFFVNQYYTNLYGISGLQDGFYKVRRYEVRKNISFANHYNLGVWGNGVFTTGLSNSTPNFGAGFCEVIPGTLTNTSATLRTYVYEVFHWLGGPSLGWFPRHPNQVEFSYTINGVLLSGPPLPPRGFTVSVSGQNNALLNWLPNNDPDLSQYKIYRTSQVDGNGEPINF